MGIATRLLTQDRRPPKGLDGFTLLREETKPTFTPDSFALAREQVKPHLVRDSFALARELVEAKQLAAGSYVRTFDTPAYDGIVELIGSLDSAEAYANPHPHRLTASQVTDQDATRTADKALDHGLDSVTGCSHTANTASAWWQLDLGANQALEVDHYGIQGRSSGGQHPRNWKLQGSNDGTTWTDLHTATADTSVDDGTWGDWAVADATSWRYVRILQTGANSSSADYLVLGEVELWGTLTVT